MKRFHVHVAVEDLANSTRFYSALFGTQPAVEKVDYAKWMLDDPRINFAIYKRGSKQGINHLGFQVDSSEELAALQSQHEAANGLHHHRVRQRGRRSLSVLARQTCHRTLGLRGSGSSRWQRRAKARSFSQSVPANRSTNAALYRAAS